MKYFLFKIAGNNKHIQVALRFTRKFKPKDTQRFREKFKAQKYDEITFIQGFIVPGNDNSCDNYEIR